MADLSGTPSNVMISAASPGASKIRLEGIREPLSAGLVSFKESTGTFGVSKHRSPYLIPGYVSFLA